MYTPQFHQTDVTLCFICENVGKGLCRALMVCRIANTDQHFSTTIQSCAESASRLIYVCIYII